MNSDITLNRIFKEYSLKDIHNLLVQSDNLYYNNIYPDQPTSSSSKSFMELTDQQYDTLREYYNNNNNTKYANIGADITNNKIQLPIHMGSMDKIKKDSTELRSFIKNYTHTKCISEKLDGISLLLDLTSKTVKAYTRGDGTIGQNVSHIIEYIKNLKKPLREFRNGNLDFSGYIRGELIISKGNWAKINHKGKNARNYVSGIVNKKEIIPTDFDYVDFVAYQYIPYPLSPTIITPSIQMQFMTKIGFTIAKYELFSHSLIKSECLMNTLLDWKEKSQYEIDGIIITDNYTHQLTLSGNPLYAKAFKFNSLDDSIPTKVKHIEWNISKDGKLKPTIIVEPIDIEGVTIQRVTAFNARYIVDNKIGTDAIIRIIRSGGVIPYIVGIDKGVTPNLPDMNKDNLVWDTNNVDIIIKNINNNFISYESSDDEIDDRKVDNELTLTERMDVKLIEHFIQIMGIEFYKAKTIEKGYIQANIKNIYDLLKATKSTFEKIEGIRNKSSDKIVASINKQINSVPIHVFAAALSIFPNMGVKKLEVIFNNHFIINLIVQYYTTEEHALYGQIKSKILNTGGFSATSANTFIDNFVNFYELWEYVRSNYPNSKIAKYPDDDEDIIDLSNDDNKTNNNSNYPNLKNLHGLRIIFSGFRNPDLEKHIKTHHGYIADTITKSSNGILIVKDKNKTTSKMIKAQTLNYSIMTEEDFIKEYSI